MKIFNTVVSFFIFITLLSSCGLTRVKNINKSLPSAKTINEKQVTPKEDFIIGFNPLNDDPDNPSPHNPLVKKFGDIPEVRTYIRFKRKLHNVGLTIDEGIELYTAEVRLYPSDAAKAALKDLIKDKERSERHGLDMDAIVISIVEDEKENKETD